MYKLKTIVATSLLVLIPFLSGCFGTTGVGGAIGNVANSITGAVGAGTEVSGRTTNVSALLATNRFKIVDRKNIAELMNEVNFGASGAVSAGSVAKFGKVVGARLIVTASITDFEDSGGSKGGAGAGGTGILAGLGGATKKTYMAINLEVIDVETSEIVASEQIDATVRDVSIGALFGGGSSSGGALAGVAGWDNEPKGKALQKVINSAVTFLEEKVPQRYYTESSV